jgi:hypothetical protein
MQGDALGAIDNRGREILVAETSDPLRELPAERGYRSSTRRIAAVIRA